jgi:hypothetical protein
VPARLHAPAPLLPIWSPYLPSSKRCCGSPCVLGQPRVLKSQKRTFCGSFPFGKDTLGSHGYHRDWPRWNRTALFLENHGDLFHILASGRPQRLYLWPLDDLQGTRWD